jgi:hypothetical protein
MRMRICQDYPGGYRNRASEERDRERACSSEPLWNLVTRPSIMAAVDSPTGYGRDNPLRSLSGHCRRVSSTPEFTTLIVTCALEFMPCTQPRELVHLAAPKTRRGREEWFDDLHNVHGCRMLRRLIVWVHRCCRPSRLYPCMQGCRASMSLETLPVHLVTVCMLQIWKPTRG